jgi:hypothetical protein
MSLPASSRPAAGGPATGGPAAGGPATGALAVALAVTLGALAGCGHPASTAECDELFAKSAEIELRAQRVTDPKVIEERTAAARAAEPGVAFAGRCVGRRITSRALECARQATTAEQLDRCL